MKTSDERQPRSIVMKLIKKRKFVSLRNWITIQLTPSFCPTLLYYLYFAIFSLLLINEKAVKPN